MLQQETQYKYEVIIVDNNSNDVDLLKKKTIYNDVLWLPISAQNPYASRNLGIRQAKGKTIALLDAKCRPNKNWLEVGINSVSDQKIIAGQYNVIPASDQLKDLLYGLLYLNNEKNVRYGYGITTGNLWAHRSTFDKIGLFDEEHISGNDIAWSLKAKSLGYEVEYVRELEVEYPGQSYSQLSQSVSKYMSGIAYQHKKNSPVIYRIIFFLKNLFPLRASTFRELITYRRLDNLSTKDKCYLWLLSWRMKTRMAKAYLASSISQ